jgi:hypothetical protein
MFFNGASDFQTGHLAMETLLSLTSKRAGDWFKEELRLLGGLDHIVDKGMDAHIHNVSMYYLKPEENTYVFENVTNLKRSFSSRL